MEEHRQSKFIIDTLFKEGFVAYYAGGWVRDFLLGHPSDDIDIATNASPEMIQALFPKTVPIGLAFGIILVIVDGNEYEVATFRNDFDYRDGRRPSRIEFTTAEEDAKRRDFTINGMFYNPLTKEVLDYVGGKEDLKRKVIRAIGNPHQRIREDRLRMIRAIRLSCRFHFEIEAKTKQAILDHAAELFPSVAIERVVQELEKAHKSRKLSQVLTQLHEYNLLPTLFPLLSGIPLLEIERRVNPLQHFPHKAPLIAYLLSLFPGIELEKQIELNKQLKLSAIDTHFISSLHRINELLKKGEETELVEWAHLYALQSTPIALQVIAAYFSNLEREAFLKEHEMRIAFLLADIERIKMHTPVIQAKDLAQEGISPSKTMGLLLKEAERISINQRITNAKDVLNQLKISNLWPK
jgi:poly(A) polymerase